MKKIGNFLQLIGVVGGRVENREIPDKIGVMASLPLDASRDDEKKENNKFKWIRGIAKLL